VPHHNSFQYFASTANPLHLPPMSVAMVGKTDRANHLYDLDWFWRAARAGYLPAVSFLKAPAYQNGHPGNSDPLDEQVFLVTVVNFLQQLPDWRHMAP
jgi:phospholipase C